MTGKGDHPDDPFGTAHEFSDADPMIDLAAQAADGSLDTDQAHPELNDPQLLNSLRQLSALKTAFSNLTHEIESKPHDLPGQWGHLQILEAIGQGAFGVVYRAFDPVLQRQVALKLRSSGEPQGIESAQRFIDEARRLARVYHPNVLAVHGADIHDHRAGLWADLIEGDTLTQRLSEQGPMTRERIIDIAEQLVEAIGAIHAQGLIHGDIKADNVMWHEGRVILMDFGAAQQSGSQARFGSPATMAPEQWERGTVTEATDLYALGGLLFRLATGELLPNDAPEAQPVMIRRQLRPRLGYALSRLIAALLSRQPSDRPTLPQVRQSLADLRLRPARKRRMLAVAVVILSLAVGLIMSLRAVHQGRIDFARSEAVKDLVVESVQKLLPEDNFGVETVVRMYRDMAEKVEADLQSYPDARAEMQLAIGRALVKYGHYDEGARLAEAGHALMQTSRPDSHRDLSASHELIASVRKDIGDFEGAERALELALNHYRQMPQTDAVQRDVIRVHSQRALLLRTRGKWFESMDALQSVMNLRTALVGADDPWLAIDHYHLGNQLTGLGHCEDALEHLSRALELLQREGDTTSLRTSYVRHAVGRCQIMLGQEPDPLARLEQMKQEYQALVSADHVVFILLDIDRAKALNQLGQGQQAIEIYRRLLVDGELKDSDRYKVRLNLAMLLMDQQQWTEARVLLDELQAEPIALYTPLFAWVSVARELARAQLQGSAETVIPSLDAAIAQWNADGYSRVEAVQWLMAQRGRLQP